MDPAIRDGIRGLARQAHADALDPGRNAADLAKPLEPPDDVTFFTLRPSRSYRLRTSGAQVVAVRRLQSGRFLTITVTKIPRDADFDDGEALAELTWWRSAYGQRIDRAKLSEMMKRARRSRS